MKSGSAGDLKSAGIYWRWPPPPPPSPPHLTLSPPSLPLSLDHVNGREVPSPPPSSSSPLSCAAFLACLNKACLPGRGWIPLWPFALWPEVHSICKVRNSSEVQLMGVRFFFFLSLFGLCSCTRSLEGWKTSSMYTPAFMERWFMGRSSTWFENLRGLQQITSGTVEGPTSPIIQPDHD